MHRIESVLTRIYARYSIQKKLQGGHEGCEMIGHDTEIHTYMHISIHMYIYVSIYIYIYR
jgi:hypothetical protein